jgi:hypothetical protein
MDYDHPTVRAETINANLMSIAKGHLMTLFQEVKTSVPTARLTKSGDAIIVPSADNKHQLIVTIPTTGNNNTALCASLTGNTADLQMAWVVFTAPNTGMIVCTAKPEYHPLSASNIVAWFNRE